MIGVTGASGGIGGRVARRLAERGVEQRLIVRDSARAPELDGAEVVEVEGYADGESMRRGFGGVDKLLLVSAAESANRRAEHESAIDAAAAAGVEHVVYTSFLSAAPDCEFTFGRDHYFAEEHIKARGLGYTFLRDSIYLDFIPVFAGEDRVIRGPADDGRLAPVARDDVADVAAVALSEDGHVGQAYPMTGGESMTLSEAAAIVSRVAGVEVRFEDETLEEARASRKPSGAPEWMIEGWVTTYSQIATGALDIVADTVERLTGHAPVTLEDFLRANPDSWRHLTR